MKSLLKSDPKSIGPFKLIARLGAGGMGTVYLATRGTQSVAVKVLHPASADNSQAKMRFRKEVQALSQITSAYVAKVIDSDIESEYSWLAVEFVNGPDLKALVEERGPLTQEEWRRFAHGLLSGIEAIHSQGLIHRDIKPGNILITESGPKIIDFGIAQDLDATSMTMTGLVAGSPGWLSPEQIDGLELTKATDLFSAGSVLTFAATGNSPWGNESTTTSLTFNRILNKEPSLDGLSKSQSLIIEPLLNKDPVKRPNLSLSINALSGTQDLNLQESLPIKKLVGRKSRRPKLAIFMLTGLAGGFLIVSALALSGFGSGSNVENASTPSQSSTLEDDPVSSGPSSSGSAAPESVPTEQPTQETTPRPVDSASPSTQQLSLEILVSKTSSGRSESEKSNALLGWSTDGLSARFKTCYTEGFIDYIDSSGQEIYLEAKVDGSWQKLKSLQLGSDDCVEGARRPRLLSLSKDEVLRLTKVGACSEIRMVQPKVPNFYYEKPVNLCLKLSSR